MDIYDAVVIGAGQAGLAASYELRRRRVNFVVLDRNDSPGGAWQHRWDSLTMKDVHGIANLPSTDPPAQSSSSANQVIPEYFGQFEADQQLPIERPVRVTEVVPARGSVKTDPDAPLLVKGITPAGERTWLARAIVNATGTWGRPFIPYYPGAQSFAGRQFHTVSYPGPEYFRGKRTLVVGGGASAVQFLGEIGTLTDTLWVTRREPQWAADGFDGLGVVTGVEERVVQGLPPKSVSAETGITLRAQEQEAKRLGVYDRWRLIFDRIEPAGVSWDNGDFEPFDVILWATGFRPDVKHLSPLGLLSKHGGIALQRVKNNVQGATTSVRDPRVHFVGYGPSASTVGALRAARTAAKAVAQRARSQTQ